MNRKGTVRVAKYSIALLIIASFAMLAPWPALGLSAINGTFGVYVGTTNSTLSNLSMIINWTGPANITAFAYRSQMSVQVNNGSTYINGLYWQNGTDFYPTGGAYHQNLNSSTYTTCFTGTALTLSLAANNNVTGNQTSWNMTNITTIVNSTLFNIGSYNFCPPGAYYGNMTVADVYNSSEHTNVTVTVIIPVSSENAINATAWNYTGTVKGSMPTNATYYHSYYFNLTGLTNATGLTMNLSGGFNQTIGAYLIHGNTTPIAQCENLSSCEIPFIRIVNASDYSAETGNMLELRVYGNFTAPIQNYRVGFYFSTINVTNATSDGPVDVLEFGTLTPNVTNVYKNFTLVNVGGANVTGINQTIDLYWQKEWRNLVANQARNGTQSNLSIVVPNFTVGVEVTLQWRNTTNLSYMNVTNWDLYLSDPSGRIVAASTNAFNASNFTNASSTEKIIYSGAVFNASNSGIWNITVNSTPMNNLNATNYDVIVRMRFNLTNTTMWVRTNFSETSPYSTLNMSGLANATRYVAANISVPLTDMLNGTYYGFIQYSNAGPSGAGWKVQVPFSFQVNTGQLVINSSIYNTTVRITENTGLFARRNLNISLANTGGSSVIYIMTNSSNLSYGGAYFVNFTMDTYSQTNTSGIMAANENRSLNVTLSVNTSYTGNTQGLYTGWVTFNITQNATNNVSIHNIFNVSIEFNLTNNLVTNITEYLVGAASNHNPFIIWTGNASNNTNVTMLVNVSLQNGTLISNNLLMDQSNFTAATLTETNVTSYSVALTTIRAGRVQACDTDGFCAINATIPASVPGGRYRLSVTANWNTTGRTDLNAINLTGSGAVSPLTIWAPGLRLSSSNSSSISMGEYTDVYYNMTVVNYGPQSASSGIIYMNNSCAHVVINASSSGAINGTCTTTATTTNNFFTVTSIGGNGSACWVLFKVHSVNVSEAKSCGVDTGINVSTSVPSYNNITGIDISIANTDGGSGGSSSSAGAGSTAPTYYYNRSVAIVTYNTNFNAKLGENISTTVTVKNTGNTTTIVYLTATTNNSAITSLSDPTFVSLGSGATGSFKVYLNISNASKLGLFAGTFKAYVEGYADTWYDTKKFDFNVNATAERVAELGVSYSNYTAQLGNLTALFNSIKASGLADIGNLTKVGSLFNDTTDLIGKIDAAINSSNYAAAESLIAELAATISRIQTGLADLEASKSAGQTAFFGDLVFWIIIAVIVAGAVGVVIYMLLPPKGGVSRIKGLKIKKPKGDGDDAKAKISNIFKGSEKGELKIPRMKEDVSLSDYAELNGGKVEYMTSKYAEGYERHDMKKGKFKSIFKRKKQERLKDFMKK